MQNFDAQWYLNNYKDVELSGMDPFYHYQKIGRLIGRHPMDPKKYPPRRQRSRQLRPKPVRQINLFGVILT